MSRYYGKQQKDFGSQPTMPFVEEDLVINEIPYHRDDLLTTASDAV